MLDLTLLVAGALALAVAASARWLDHLPVSGPSLALLTGVALGPRGLDVLSLVPTGPSPALGDVARATIAVSLMAVALRYPLAQVRSRLPQLGWLLVVVLPLMTATTAGLAAVMLAVPVGIALTVGAALAPTDPVLASSVVGGDAARRVVPDELRQDLSLESGANDGLAAPFVLAAAAVATSTVSGQTVGEVMWHTLGAIAMGATVGWAAGWALTAAERHRTIDRTHVATYSLVLALGTLGLGGVTHTDDLLVVFTAGLAFNAVISGEDRTTEELIDESVHKLLVLPVFLLLGAVLPWTAWAELGVAGVGFAVAVLLVRRLPWIVLLRRPLGATGPGSVWFGWFGPIGVAAIVYLVVLHERGVTDPEVWAAGSLVVTASTLVHGATAPAGVALLDRTDSAER